MSEFNSFLDFLSNLPQCKDKVDSAFIEGLRQAWDKHVKTNSVRSEIHSNFAGETSNIPVSPIIITKAKKKGEMAFKTGKDDTPPKDLESLEEVSAFLEGYEGAELRYEEVHEAKRNNNVETFLKIVGGVVIGVFMERFLLNTSCKTM